MSTNNLVASISFQNQETLDATDYPAASDAGGRTLRASSFNVNATLNASSTPALEKTPVTKSLTIGASATVLDLTAVDIAIGRTEDMTGKKLIAYQFATDSGNTGDVTIDADASNGYNLLGSSGLVVLTPGESIGGIISGVSSTKPAVSATVKGVRIDGTQNDVVSVALWFGT